MNIGVDPDMMHFGIRKNLLECGSVVVFNSCSMLQDKYIAKYSVWKCLEL